MARQTIRSAGVGLSVGIVIWNFVLTTEYKAAAFILSIVLIAVFLSLILDMVLHK